MARSGGVSGWFRRRVSVHVHAVSAIAVVALLLASVPTTEATDTTTLSEFQPVPREGNALFNQILGEEAAHLDDQLKNHPDLEDIHFPTKYNIPVDFYREEAPIGYIMSVIFDPCRGHDFNCCNDTYGTPEFRDVIDDPSNNDLHGTDRLSEQDGSPLSTTEASRRPTDQLVIDEACTDANVPDLLCVAERVRRQNFTTTPFCWDHRFTLAARQSCRSPVDGSTLPLCMELGFTQTAYIVECGGAFQDDNHCGTFLEIHRVDGEKPDEILAETKLRGQFTSGYRMTVISTTYKGNASMVLCTGEYQMWWVLRTRYDWIIQRKTNFTIVTPACDWDPVNNKFQEFATTATAPDVFGLDPFDPDKFLFSATAITGEPGYPAEGMGSTLVQPSEDIPSSITGGKLPGINFAAGTYQPNRPTISEFEAKYPHIELNQDGMPLRAKPSPLP